MVVSIKSLTGRMLEALSTKRMRKRYRKGYKGKKNDYSNGGIFLFQWSNFLPVNRSEVIASNDPGLHNY